MRFTDSDVTFQASGRVPGEFLVLVKGAIRFVGSHEAAQHVYYSLINKALPPRRDEQDRALRRILR